MMSGSKLGCCKRTYFNPIQYPIHRPHTYAITSILCISGGKTTFLLSWKTVHRAKYEIPYQYPNPPSHPTYCVLSYPFEEDNIWKLRWKVKTRTAHHKHRSLICSPIIQTNPPWQKHLCGYSSSSKSFQLHNVWNMKNLSLPFCVISYHCITKITKLSALCFKIKYIPNMGLKLHRLFLNFGETHLVL